MNELEQSIFLTVGVYQGKRDQLEKDIQELMVIRQALPYNHTSQNSITEKLIAMQGKVEVYNEVIKDLLNDLLNN